MRSLLMLPLCAVFFALTGCGTIKYERASFDGATVTNPTLGSGVRYQIPAGYAFLNPYAPLPTKPQNAAFERYVRRLAAIHDKTDNSAAFRECMLFRNDDRYLVLVHVSLNFPKTFRAMGPQGRARLLPELAQEIYRFFDAPNRDFNYTFEQINGRNLILCPPFTPEAAGNASEGWRGTGFSLLGDRTDVVAVVVFSRVADLPAAQADLRSIRDNFTYGLSAK